MTITGTNLGKKFGSHWIFKDLSLQIESGEAVALVGPNGSGKSTLLQIICSALTPSRGEIQYISNEQTVDAEKAILQINFASPYTELIEELTLEEHLNFHSQFKRPTDSPENIARYVGLSDAFQKPIAQFSSGMKQRTKLALQFYFDGEVIALDEPTSNLDEEGKQLYRREIQKLLGSKTILIASNDRLEYDFCEKSIDLRIS